MVDFLVWLMLICVLPFVLAMFEVWLKESGSAIRAESAGDGCPTPVHQKTIMTRAPAFRPVIDPEVLSGQRSHAGYVCGQSEGASLHSDLVLHDIWLPSPSGGKSTSRSLVFKNSFHQCQQSLRRSGWTCLN
jgi:hypothetical protein